MSKLPATLRLDRLISNLGYGSRKEAQAMARNGWIVLDGEPLTEAERHVKITPDLASRMTVQGKPLDPPPGVVVMMHKPLGVTCSRKEAGPLVYDLLPIRWRRREPMLSTIGRLDKDTSGLLLFTDDGDLQHRVISPKRHVPKRYRVTLARPLSGEEAAVFASGALMLESEDKPLLPADLQALSPTTARLTVHEGRYHQVRRMFAAVGNHVEALHRDRMGGLDLPEDLAPGALRVLGAEDVSKLFD
jgi:16S rRNA pseudouridine516 synthase